MLKPNTLLGQTLNGLLSFQRIKIYFKATKSIGILTESIMTVCYF